MTHKYKSDWVTGLEVLLNNKNANPLKNHKVFGEIQKESGMPLSHMIKHLGKTSKKNKQPEKPTDKERSEARLANMEK